MSASDDPNLSGDPGAQPADPTAVWAPGGAGLPPTLRWDGSGPPPGLPDPTPWNPAGPQVWQDPGAFPSQAGPAAQASQGQWAAPGGQHWIAGQPPAQSQWGAPGFGAQPNAQWNHGAGQAGSWGQQPVQKYGEVPSLEHYGVQPYGQSIPGGPKSGGKAWVWVAAGVAALLLGGVAITAVALSGDEASSTAGTSTPSMVSALTTSPAPSSTKPKSTTPSPTGAAAGKTPLIEGYQVVAAPDRGAAYDVPPGWKVATETTIGGVGEPPGDTVIGKGYATDGRDYCPGSTRTMSLLTGSKQTDHAAAGAELGTKAARLAYGGATGTPHPAEPLTSIDGTTTGMFTETTGTVPTPTPGCAPPSPSTPTPSKAPKTAASSWS
ncbi:hypothetical protein ACSVDM_15840 [Nocardia sp. JW2]|uniref:hypothetical protein n=1 Tax=Nocardia sp. JW2 TaxID=3450738 RepID=UPI003F42AD1A